MRENGRTESKRNEKDIEHSKKKVYGETERQREREREIQTVREGKK